MQRYSLADIAATDSYKLREEWDRDEADNRLSPSERRTIRAYIHRLERRTERTALARRVGFRFARTGQLDKNHVTLVRDFQAVHGGKAKAPVQSGAFDGDKAA